MNQLDVFLATITAFSVAISWIALNGWRKESKARRETEALYFFTRWMQSTAEQENSGLRITESGIEFE